VALCLVLADATAARPSVNTVWLRPKAALGFRLAGGRSTLSNGRGIFARRRKLDKLNWCVGQWQRDCR